MLHSFLIDVSPSLLSFEICIRQADVHGLVLRKFKHPDKKRPVVILTRNSILECLGEVTIAPVTSTRRDIPSEVLLSRKDGMHKVCAINCDHIQTVSKSSVGSMITALSKEKLSEVRDAINFALNL